jgi:hypothetical protein
MSKDAKSKEPEVQEVEQHKIEKPKEKYYRMRFHAKSNPNDEDDVKLSVNGETVVIERQKDVVLPERYKVCAENARSPQFRQLPNQPRKLVGEIITFPFDMIGEGTEDEYLDMKRSGTKATKEAVERDGSNA